MWECNLKIICSQLDWQLSSATQILSQLSPLLPNVKRLDIRTSPTLPTGNEDVDSAQWLELFQLFPHSHTLFVAEPLGPCIAHALVDMVTETLPAFSLLSLSGYRKSPSAAEAVEKFVTMRTLSGHKVSVYG